MKGKTHRYYKKKKLKNSQSENYAQNDNSLTQTEKYNGEQKTQKSRKFNTEHIIFLSIPKFELPTTIYPKKENYSEKELTSLQSSLEALQFTLVNTNKKLENELEHILELQTAEDECSTVQEEDYNQNPDKYNTDLNHFSSEEDDDLNVEESLSPVPSPSLEQSPERGYDRKKESTETPIRKGKRGKAKTYKNRGVAKVTERKKKKRILDTPNDDTPTHIPTNFWPHISPFISPLSFVDMEFLCEKSESLTKEQLALPPLGQIELEPKEDKKKSKHGNSSNNNKDVKQAPPSPLHTFYTNRLLAALLEDPYEKSHDLNQFHSHITTSLDESENIEDRIINELKNIGILDDNAIQIDPSHRKDDEICEEIRSIQKQLIDIIEVNNQRKSEFLELALNKMSEQFSDRQLKMKTSHIEKLYSRRMLRNRKRRTKGRMKGRGGHTTSPSRPLPGKKPYGYAFSATNSGDILQRTNTENTQTESEVRDDMLIDGNSGVYSPGKMDFMDDEMDTVPPPPDVE